jgi:hypothetical protein
MQTQPAAAMHPTAGFACCTTHDGPLEQSVNGPSCSVRWGPELVYAPQRGSCNTGSKCRGRHKSSSSTHLPVHLHLAWQQLHALLPRPVSTPSR